MRTLIICLGVCALLVGCQTNSTGSVEIVVTGNGAFTADGKAGNLAELQQYLGRRLSEDGDNLEIVLEADRNTPFSFVEPVILQAVRAHVVFFSFRLSGTSKLEKCNSNHYPSSKPRQTVADVEIEDNQVFIGKGRASKANLETILSGRPYNGRRIDLLLVSCSGTTTFGSFYDFIKQCNQSERVAVELQVSTKLEQNGK